MSTPTTTTTTTITAVAAPFFVMERFPEPELNWSTPWSDQFEAYVYCNPTSMPLIKSWQWQLLPPPPFVREFNHWNSSTRPEINSYALLGSDICISVNGVGTYSLDTASHTWTKVANWTLPFHGRVDYEWEECKDSQLVNLGSGTFCILRFFHTHNQRNGCNIAVFTGVEVMPRVQEDATGEVQLHMISHKSLCHQSKTTTIDSVF
uniref:Uncharacterized protein n=1 Tax=Leersia perrieri TaxID=77586 RepID=A0A0D9Y1W6_9ORYZ